MNSFTPDDPSAGYMFTNIGPSIHGSALDRLCTRMDYPVPYSVPCNAELGWGGKAQLSIEALDCGGYVLGRAMAWYGPLSLYQCPSRTATLRVRSMDFVDEPILFTLSIAPLWESQPDT